MKDDEMMTASELEGSSPALRAQVKKKKQSCRTCKYLLRPKTGGVRKGNVYVCTFEVELPPLPKSITSYYAFRSSSVFDMSNRAYVQPDDGTDCPCWEKALDEPRGLSASEGASPEGVTNEGR